MSCTPLPKAAKPVWAKQLTRLPCLVVYAKFNLYITALDEQVLRVKIRETHYKYVWQFTKKE